MTYRGEKQDALIQVRCYGREKRILESAAQARKKTVSELIREFIASLVAKQRDGKERSATKHAGRAERIQ